MKITLRCLATVLLAATLTGSVRAKQNPLGLSIGYPTASNMAAMAEFAAVGVEVIELKDLHRAGHDEAKLAELQTGLESLGIRVHSIHFPFTREFNLSEADLRESTIAEIKVYLDMLSRLGGRYLVVHPSREPIPDEERSERFALSRKSILELDAIMKAYPGLTIAIENLPRTCLGNTAEELLRLIEGTSPERIGICLDTNHMLQEDLLTFTEQTLCRIVTVHISDYDFDDEKHWLPGQGVIEWDKWVQMMRAAEYRGPWLYEVSWPAIRGRHVTPRQMAALIKLNYQDYFAAD